MRFVDDDELSFCLTLSTGIKKDELLAILGRVEVLPEPQTFDDFAWDTHQPGKRGLLNVFEQDEFLVTLENNGFMGVAKRTISSIANIYGAVHYVAFYRSSGNAGHQYVEVQDGLIIANFDPLLDEAPEAVSDFFTGAGTDTGDFPPKPRRAMVQAAEYRLETTIKPEWLELPTETYVIDYRTNRH